MCLGVAVESDVSYFCYGDEAEYAVNHAESRTEDRNDGELLTLDLLRNHSGYGSFDFDILNGNVAGYLIAHEHCDLGEKLSEVLASRILFSHNAELMLDQRMVYNMEGICVHYKYVLSPFSPAPLVYPRTAQAFVARVSVYLSINYYTTLSALFQ